MPTEYEIRERAIALALESVGDGAPIERILANAELFAEFIASGSTQKFVAGSTVRS